MTFFDFLADYWWLGFPLAWFVAAGFNSWLKFQQHKANLDLMKSYAASGNQPPEKLLKAFEEKTMAEDSSVDKSEDWDGGATPFLVIMFVGFAAIFAYAGKTGMLGLGEEAYFIAMILIVLSLAFLGGAILIPRKKKRK